MQQRQWPGLPLDGCGGERWHCVEETLALLATRLSCQRVPAAPAGFALEMWGFWLLFSAFFPTVLSFLRCGPSPCHARKPPVACQSTAPACPSSRRGCSRINMVWTCCWLPIPSTPPTPPPARLCPAGACPSSKRCWTCPPSRRSSTKWRQREAAYRCRAGLAQRPSWPTLPAAARAALLPLPLLPLHAPACRSAFSPPCFLTLTLP